MNQTKISVITVSFNSEATIKRTIESVLAQTYTNLDYWIIDGASQDATVKIAESYRNAFAGRGISYHIISEKDHGMYYAMQKGVDHAAGDVIGILNSDDWYEPDTAEKVAKAYVETGFDMLQGAIRIHKPNSQIVKTPRKRFYWTSLDWCHPAAFITKETYKKYPYKLKNGYDDFDLATRINKNCHVVFTPEILTNFSYGGASTTNWSIKTLVTKIYERYEVYRVNGYSRLYILECVWIETAKCLYSLL